MRTQHGLLLGLLLILTKNIQAKVDNGKDYNIYRTAQSDLQLSTIPSTEPILKGTTQNPKSSQNVITESERETTTNKMEILARHIFPQLLRLLEDDEMESATHNIDYIQTKDSGNETKSHKDISANSKKMLRATEQFNKTQKEQSEGEALIRILRRPVLDQLLESSETVKKLKKSLDLENSEAGDKHKNFTIRKYEEGDEQNIDHRVINITKFDERVKKSFGFSNSTSDMDGDKNLTVRSPINKDMKEWKPLFFPKFWAENQKRNTKSPAFPQFSRILTNATKARAALAVGLETNEFKAHALPRREVTKSELFHKRDILDIINDIQNKGQASAKKTIESAEEIPYTLSTLSNELAKIFKERDVLSDIYDSNKTLDKLKENSVDTMKTDTMVKLSNNFISSKDGMFKNETDKQEKQDNFQKNSTETKIIGNEGLKNVNNNTFKEDIHMLNKTDNHSEGYIETEGVEDKGKKIIINISGITQSYGKNQGNDSLFGGISKISNGTRQRRELKDDLFNLNRTDNMTLVNVTIPYKTELNTVSAKATTSVQFVHLNTTNTDDNMNKNFNNLTMGNRTEVNSANNSEIIKNNETQFINTTDMLNGSSNIINSTMKKFRKLLNDKLNILRQKRNDNSIYEMKSHTPDYLAYKIESQKPDDIEIKIKTLEPVNKDIVIKNITESDIRESLLNTVKTMLKIFSHFGNTFRDSINDQPTEEINPNMENETLTAKWIVHNGTKVMNTGPFSVGLFEYLEQVHIINDDKTEPAPRRLFSSKSKTHLSQQAVMNNDNHPHDETNIYFIARDVLCKNSGKPTNFCRQVCRIIYNYRIGSCSKWGYCQCFIPFNRHRSQNSDMPIKNDIYY